MCGCDDVLSLTRDSLKALKDYLLSNVLFFMSSNAPFLFRPGPPTEPEQELNLI